MTTETTTTERITYAGRRTRRDGTGLTYVYMHEGEELHFKRALLPATVGATLLVEMTVNPDGTRRVGNATYTGDRTTGEVVERHAALDAAANGANEARKHATKHDPLVEALGPIRDAYMMASPVERAALLTNVIRKITTYS
jgi:hypothetical protein